MPLLLDDWVWEWGSWAGRLAGTQVSARRFSSLQQPRAAPCTRLTSPIAATRCCPAALQVGMKCVALAGRHPVYELSAADLVVRDLAQLSFINLKQLFAAEERVSRQVGVPGVVWDS
jgi:hypothetical protein